MLWMMMISLAFAAPCEWSAEPQSVEAFRRTIIIDGERYKAKDVARQLGDCGQDEAAEAVERWQTQRKVARANALWGMTQMCFGVFIPLTAIKEGASLVESAEEERERAVALIKMGDFPDLEAPPVVSPRLSEGDSTTETDETLDPSTFNVPYDE